MKHWRIWVLAGFAMVLGACATPEQIILLEGEDGSVGELVVEKDGKSVRAG